MVDEKPAPEPGRRHRERTDIPRTALANKVQEVISSLEGGALEIQGKKVEKLPETVTFELEYAEQRNERFLEIRVNWVPPRSGKKT
jgi:Tfp pilus assembly protein PilZ